MHQNIYFDAYSGEPVQQAKYVMNGNIPQKSSMHAVYDKDVKDWLLF